MFALLSMLTLRNNHLEGTHPMRLETAERSLGVSSVTRPNICLVSIKPEEPRVPES